jgi:spore maturation protein CgeB
VITLLPSFPGDSKDLGNQLQYVTDHAEEIKEKAAAGQIDIKARFNWDTITDQYIDLLKKNKGEYA